MTSENKAAASPENKNMNKRNALIIKIALFLNYLTKENHQKLIQFLNVHENADEIDILKAMLAKKFITPLEANSLKKTCINFAKAPGDARFGSLCIKFGFLTQSNMDLALEEQERLAGVGQKILLGDLLIDAGMLSERQRNLILQKQKFEGVHNKRLSGQTAGKDKNNAQSNQNGSVVSAEDKDGKPPFDLGSAHAIEEVEIKIYIQQDALKAFVQKTDDFDSSMLIADLRFLLEKNSIIYGVADDDAIEKFIKDNKNPELFFEIANGLEPVDGTDAQLVYMFERDYLKAGHLEEDGTIDFKDRGTIPFVDEKDILAEKIPPKPGKAGVSVYGEAIPCLEAEDIPFNLGKNVSLSEDELKVVADVAGNPKVSQTGEISVNDAYFIEGDVDYKTGHVKFDKNVFIAGSIKSGFRVEAIDVVANTIDGGIVKAQGDVFIQNGATESEIEAHGTIKAGFMHRSKACCTGNIEITKEIIDTKIVLY